MPTRRRRLRREGRLHARGRRIVQKSFNRPRPLPERTCRVPEGERRLSESKNWISESQTSCSEHENFGSEPEGSSSKARLSASEGQFSDSRRGGLRQSRRSLDGRGGLRRLLLESLAEDLADVLDEDELHLSEKLLRNLLHVAPVELRQYDLCDARAPRRQELLLDAADGQDVTAQGYLARHRHVLPNGALRDRR